MYGFRVLTVPNAGKLGEVASAFFERLVATRAAVAHALSLDIAALELSMGMSGDYELAIQHGSTNVRVGSAIFGEREYKASKRPAAEEAPPSSQFDAPS